MSLLRWDKHDDDGMRALANLIASHAECRCGYDTHHLFAVDVVPGWPTELHLIEHADGTLTAAIVGVDK
jgi:hypothetical protein